MRNPSPDATSVVFPAGMGIIATWQAVDETLRGRHALSTASDVRGHVVTVYVHQMVRQGEAEAMAAIKRDVRAVGLFDVTAETADSITVTVRAGTTWRATNAAIAAHLPPLDSYHWGNDDDLPTLW